MQLHSQAMDSAYFASNSHSTWNITNIWSQDSTAKYSRKQFNTITINIVLGPKSLYFVMFLISPCVFLGVLNLFLFVIPSTGGEKISYGMSIILSEIMFLLVIVDHLPQTSDNFPLFLMYLCLVISLSALSVICAVLTIHVLNNHQSILARWTRKIFPQKFLISHSQRKIKQKEITSEHNVEHNDNNSNNIVSAKKGEESVEVLNTERTEKKEAIGMRDLDEEGWLLVGKFLDQMFLIVFSLLFSLLTSGFYIGMIQ